jgi:hypothetical protein
MIRKRHLMPGRLMEFFKARKIEIASSSGILRVTIPPKYPWLVIPIDIAGAWFFGSILYRTWDELSFFMRTIYV